MRKTLQSSLRLLLSGMTMPVTPPQLWIDAVQSVGPCFIESIHLWQDLWRLMPKPEQQFALIQSLFYLLQV